VTAPKVPARLPLATLLSQAVVAYTIEFDDELEQRLPHITSVGGAGGFGPDRPWLVSRVMLTNFLRHIGDDEGGTPVREVQALACVSPAIVKSRLHHLEWWQHLVVDKRVVRLTPGGARARDELKPITAAVGKRWRSRFGKDVVDGLTSSLRSIVSSVEGGAVLPDSMPVVDYGNGMLAAVVLPEPDVEALVAARRTPVAKLDVSALLSRALLALTLEFEQDSDVSLTMSANVLRVVDPAGGTSLKDVPVLGGVAKEGVSAAVNFLAKKGFVKVGTDKAKTVTLTTAGRNAREAYGPRLAEIEKRWTKRFGKDTIQSLRTSLDALAAPGKDGTPLLAKGLTPPAGSWRLHKAYAARTEAFLRDPRGALPHHPMLLHRGGYPDGS
jgi:DNA-binding MarR family transcriptional regulator